MSQQITQNGKILADLVHDALRVDDECVHFFVLQGVDHLALLTLSSSDRRSSLTTTSCRLWDRSPRSAMDCVVPSGAGWYELLGDEDVERQDQVQEDDVIDADHLHPVHLHLLAQ